MRPGLSRAPGITNIERLMTCCGVQVVNVIGFESPQMVNFVKPEDFFFGTHGWHVGNEQGGIYNRCVFLSFFHSIAYQPTSKQLSLLINPATSCRFGLSACRPGSCKSCTPSSSICTCDGRRVRSTTCLASTGASCTSSSESRFWLVVVITT